MFSRLRGLFIGTDFTSPAGRALVEERYWSLRRQVPIIYLLGFVNLAALEIVSRGSLSIGFNVPTMIGACGVIRLWHWFGVTERPTHDVMIKRLEQTVWFAAAVCLAVCFRCLYLLKTGDDASHMAVMLFGGLTGIGVAYGLTALPAAGRIPLVLIILPISMAAFLSRDPQFAAAAFSLVIVAGLTMRLLMVHSRHFTDVIQSRTAIARKQELVEQAHQEAVTSAMTDFLTSLPNRRAFVAALDIAASDKGPSPFAIAILDLNDFKSVNDTFGHAIGDQLLKEVANRLVSIVGTRGTVARLGGDEFGILLPGAGQADSVHALGKEILLHVNGPALLDGRQILVSVCCGIGISGRTELRSPSRVMADADLALYEAKDHADGGLAVFELVMDAPRRRRSDIERALQRAGVEHHFYVVFQPIFDLKRGRVLANEALARWSDPEIGAVSPAEFVPIAEQLNLIEVINNHLMDTAFKAARQWPENIKLAFNLSAIQICSPGSGNKVLQALKANGLEAARLQIEVTETALLADFERARENLTLLRNAGATIVLDDFGAGYASIGYLRELRFEQIKLDGGLVKAAQHSEDGKRLLRAVISLCEILGVSSVAEHIESEELLNLVVELGCTAGQGFWLNPPVPAERLSTLTRINLRSPKAERRRAA